MLSEFGEDVRIYENNYQDSQKWKHDSDKKFKRRRTSKKTNPVKKDLMDGIIYYYL